MKRRSFLGWILASPLLGVFWLSMWKEKTLINSLDELPLSVLNNDHIKNKQE